MSIQLETKDLVNAQQMEVAVHGPDGATHLILCTGVANLGFATHETYTFCVGPQISRRQFVGAIASGALSTIQAHGINSTIGDIDVERGAHLVLIGADFDEGYGQVKVSAEVICSTTLTKLSISYNVSILAELQRY